MVRRHSFNRRARQDLRESIEGQGEGTNVKSKRQPAAFALEVVLPFVSLRVYHKWYH
ncbi:13729_t:CDS:2, partial [Rhizophagus irregularis]